MNGTQVWLRGVNFAQYIFDWQERASQQQANYMGQWGVSSVMLVFHDTTSFSSGLIDNIIEWNAQNGIYTILLYQLDGAMYDYSGWTSTDWTNFRSVWTTIATRYQGSTNVLYALMDEPTGLTYQKYSDEMRATIDAIRAIDSDVIIVLDAENPTGGGWPLNFQFELQNPINRANVIFSIHDFAMLAYGKDPSKEAIRNWFGTQGVYDVLAQNKPVWLGSFAYDEPLTLGSLWFRNIIEVAIEDGFCGFSSWEWKTALPMRLLADWNGNPSEMGKILQEYL